MGYRGIELGGAGIDQLVEHLTERSGAILMQVQVPRMARDFSPSQLPVQTILWCLYSPLCASASAHVKNPKQLAAIPLFGHTKILHQLVGMGSTAPAAAVPYPGMATVQVPVHSLSHHFILGHPFFSDLEGV